MATVVRTNGVTYDLEDTGGLPTLGHTLVWWCRDAEIPHPELVELMAARGLAEQAPAEGPTALASLRMAVTRWLGRRARARNQGGEIGERFRLKTINTADAAIAVYLLVLEREDRRRLALDFKTDLRVLYFKPRRVGGVATGGNITVTLTDSGGRDEEIDEARELTRELGEEWERCRNLMDGHDLYRVVKDAVLGAGGVAIHPDGGVYFAPGSAAELVAGLRGLFDDLRAAGLASVALHTLPHLDIPLARQQLTEIAQRALMDELAGLGAGVKEAEDAAPGKLRVSTLTRRLGEIEALREKIREYSTLLDVREERFLPELSRLAGRTVSVARAQPEDRQERFSEVVDLAGMLDLGPGAREERSA